jgi:hypothetical protein
VARPPSRWAGTLADRGGAQPPARAGRAGAAWAARPGATVTLPPPPPFLWLPQLRNGALAMKCTGQVYATRLHRRSGEPQRRQLCSTHCSGAPGTTSPPPASIAATTRSRETRRGAKATEKYCQPPLVLWIAKSAVTFSACSSPATRASGSGCQVHCVGTRPQTIVSAAGVLAGVASAVPERDAGDGSGPHAAVATSTRTPAIRG